MHLTTFTGIDASSGGWIRGIRQTDWTLGADKLAAISSDAHFPVHPSATPTLLHSQTTYLKLTPIFIRFNMEGVWMWFIVIVGYQGAGGSDRSWAVCINLKALTKYCWNNDLNPIRQWELNEIFQKSKYSRHMGAPVKSIKKQSMDLSTNKLSPRLREVCNAVKAWCSSKFKDESVTIF